MKKNKTYFLKKIKELVNKEILFNDFIYENMIKLGRDCFNYKHKKYLGIDFNCTNYRQNYIIFQNTKIFLRNFENWLNDFNIDFFIEKNMKDQNIYYILEKYSIAIKINKGKINE